MSRNRQPSRFREETLRAAAHAAGFATSASADEPRLAQPISLLRRVATVIVGRPDRLAA